ncbi:hypothetical protein SLI_4051 [Streptomyces lividans 1326]|uniref:Uncharacterized protein n=1 Tax=Streptomyces lividans 1326 TaxID=1200984 RepID=A0A7U9DRF8_STRLI|nr:hypothetical protein SLI_4051 [Streptomyces lividans 1326]
MWHLGPEQVVRVAGEEEVDIGRFRELGPDRRRACGSLRVTVHQFAIGAGLDVVLHSLRPQHLFVHSQRPAGVRSVPCVL